MAEQNRAGSVIACWLMTLLLTLLISACGNNEAGDTGPPTVVATTPVDGETNVALDIAAVSARFSEAIAVSSIDAASFVLTDSNGLRPAGALALSGETLRYSLTSPLLPDTRYTATIAATVVDLEGNRLATPFTWQFTTGAAPDRTPPTISSVDPPDASDNVPANRRVLATFSEAIDPASVGTGGFTLVGPDGVAVRGLASVLGSVLTFTPGTGTLTEQLADSTRYVATLSTAITDLAGNPLASGRSWAFTTGVVPDRSAPTLVLSEPFNTESGVPLNAAIDATFSEAINPGTLTRTSFTVTGPDGNAIAGTIRYLGNTASFVPSARLAGSTTYTVNVTGAVTDLAGNALIAGVVANPWTFTTSAAPDITSPFINLVSPPAAAQQVCINSAINVRFNETMNASTIRADSFYISAPDGTRIPGEIRYNATTRIATFTQSANFLASTTYTVTVTADVQDRAGNPLIAGPVVNPWSFTVGATNQVCQLKVPLRSLSNFAIVADQGLAQSAGPSTVTGDIALAPIGDCVLCSAPDLVLNGTLYANDAAGIAAQAKLDLQLAFTDALGRPVGPETGSLNSRSLTPGVYSAAAAMSLDDDAALTLDALGDSNAVWVFQVGSDLRIGVRSTLALINGAQQTRVFWVVGGSLAIGSDARTAGSFISSGPVTLGNRARVTGRVFSRTGDVLLRRNSIDVSQP